MLHTRVSASVSTNCSINPTHALPAGLGAAGHIVSVSIPPTSGRSRGGHSQSLTSFIDFAKLHNKPFALPETGAGNSNAGTDVSDDAAFPQWLSQQLAAAQAAGVKISFANIWDSNGGGNYQFSLPGDGKPAEAAAWATYLGVPQTTATVTLGYGPDTLALLVAEDAWQGDAQFTVSVNGKPIGGTQTATASHAAGQVQKFNLLGSFGGSGVATVNFLNDGYGGTSATDRNLYVASAKIDGAAVPGSALTFLSGGAQSFSFNGPAVATTDTLDLHLSEDAWQGDAQYTVTIDGATIGGVRSVSASHAAGATQDVILAGNWGAGPHSIGVTFINDGYGGTSVTDRNLYVDQVSYNGKGANGAPAALYSNGTATFNVSNTAAVAALTLHLAEDAWQGDAQYSVSIDGAVLVQSGVVKASNAQNASQTVNLQTTLTAGKHDLAISFLNDGYGGSAATDRNLYVKGIEVNGTPVPGANVSMLSTGTTHFQILTLAS
jgi:hypothetical protein